MRQFMQHAGNFHNLWMQTGVPPGAQHMAPGLAAFRSSHPYTSTTTCTGHPEARSIMIIPIRSFGMHRPAHPAPRGY
jgi:hypothetical protein